MSKIIKIVCLLLFMPVMTLADECDVPADLSSYTVYPGNTYRLGIGDTDSASPGLYVDGQVFIRRGATFTGNIYATGDITIRPSGTIAGNAYSETNVNIDSNNNDTGDVEGVACENVGASCSANPLPGNPTDICESDLDLSDFTTVNEDLVISRSSTLFGDYYVIGDVLLEQGNGRDKTTLNGNVYATGDIYLENNSEITGFAYTENGIIYSNNGSNIDIDGGVCQCGEQLEITPTIDLPVDELIGQCTDIFQDAAQSYNASSELFMQNNTQILDSDTNLFPFGSIAGYYYDPDTGTNGNPPPDSCGTGVTCGITSPPSQELSSFSISENSNGVSFSLWNNQVIELGGTDESEEDYNGTIFEDIIAGSSSEITFLPLDYDAGEYYQVDSLTVQNTSTVKLSSGVYAIHTLKLDGGATIEVDGDGDVFFFVENLTALNGQLINSNGSRWFFIVNEGFDLYSSNSLDALLYSTGDITLGGFTLNGQVAAANVFLGSGTTINHEAICDPDPEPNTYSFTFDGTQTQALTCEAHSVDIQARINGTIDTGYNNSVTISTSTGLGDWTIGSANGTLDNGTAGDGNATYQFVDSDNGEIELYLSHNSAGDVSVTVSNVDATAEQALVFSSAVLKTELSCVDDSLGACINTANLPFAMTMTAVKEDDQTSECVNYNPTEINFWSEYVTPSVPTGLAVEVEGNQLGTAESAATPLAISFTDGVASVSVNYPDAGQIIVHAQDASSTDIEGEGETIVNPLQLLIEDINASNGNSNPETTNLGDGFMRASVANYNSLSVDTFELTVTGIKDCSNDTQGHCSGSYGQRTPSFASEVTLETSLVFPSSGVLGNLQYDGDDGYQVDLTSGQFTYQDLAYDEVGSFGVTATTVDGYLLSGNEITTSEVQSVGRFYPDYLALDSFNVAPGCNDDFTYIGQTAIEVNYNIKAYAQGDLTITENYDASLGYPVAGSELLSDQSDSFSDQVYDQTPLSLTDRLLPEDYYDNSLWSAGQYNVIGQEMGISKSTAPDGPYLSDDNSLDYFIKLSGLDGEKVQTDSTSTCSDDSCYLGSLKDLVYGRLQAGNGHGSEYQAIRTNVNTTYYDGSQFSSFTRDICTTLDMSQISSAPSKNSSDQITITDSISGGTGQTTVSVLNSPLIEGNSQLNFTAPSSRGSLTYYIEIDSVAPWLLDSGNAVQCPDDSSGITDCIDGYVEFGLFRGNDRVIYRLQTYD